MIFAISVFFCVDSSCGLADFCNSGLSLVASLLSSVVWGRIGLWFLGFLFIIFTKNKITVVKNRKNS